MVLLRHTISTMYHGIIFKSCRVYIIIIYDIIIYLYNANIFLAVYLKVCYRLLFILIYYLILFNLFIYLFIQHLLSALYTNKHALMRYLINIYTQ